MVIRWLSRYRAADVIAALAPHLTLERRGRIAGVIGRRLAGLTVVVEDLHDPHNGAAALRSLEAFGLASLHAVESTEPFRFSSTVSQGCEKWVELRRHPDFATCARELRAQGFTLLAAMPDAGQALGDIDVGRKIALVFGNEHAGLTAAARSACDGAFTIPMAGFTRSFNLSVSAAVSVYDCANRRRRVIGESDLTDAEREALEARFYALSMDPRAAEGIVARYVSDLTHPRPD